MLKRMVAQHFPEDPYTAQRIVSGESGWNPSIYGKVNKNGTVDGGLWQINDIHVPTMKRMGLDRMNPVDATKFARHLYDQRGGWGDWMFYVNHIAVN